MNRRGDGGYYSNGPSNFTARRKAVRDEDHFESNLGGSRRETDDTWSACWLHAGSRCDAGDSHRWAPTSRRRSKIDRRILIVHGLEHVPVNCDQVFNLFCLYGNVVTVKILKDYQVLVELEDAESAKRCVSNLHLLPLDNANKIKVKYSKHFFIRDQVSNNILPDGTPAQKVYSTSKLNRFTGKETDLGRRCTAPPSKILHFFNAPTESWGLPIHRSMSEALDRNDAIRSMTILPRKPRAKCATGLIEMNSVALAVKAILLSNHTTIHSTKSRYPFLTKLCFSKWSDVHQTSTEWPALRLTPTPCEPWLLHKSEYVSSAVELPLWLSKVVTKDGDDSPPWTLWKIKDRWSSEDDVSVDTVCKGCQRVLAQTTRPCCDQCHGDLLRVPSDRTEDGDATVFDNPEPHQRGPMGDA